MNKIDIFNARNCSKQIEDGMTLEVVDTGSFPDVDKDGHDVTVTVLKDVNGDIYCSISATIFKSMELLNEIIAENEGKPVNVTVMKSRSQNNREFYQLKINQ